MRALGVIVLSMASFAAQTRPADGVPEALNKTADVDYVGRHNPRQSFDVYTPKTPATPGPLPAIVFIHGGAWLGGNKAMASRELLPLLRDGQYVGVAVNYRLSAEAVWPAQLQDCRAAIRFLRANAATYNLDPDRIGVIGSSAGGHLVAMLGVTGETQHGTGVSCVVDLFGPADLTEMRNQKSALDHASATSPEGRLLGGAIADKLELAKAASPVTYAAKTAPPFLIIHGDADPVVPPQQSKALAEILKAAGADVTYFTVTGGGHGGWQNPAIDRRIEAFFAKHLLKQDAPIEQTPLPARG
jgi:acetyl esterase/lipase